MTRRDRDDRKNSVRPIHRFGALLRARRMHFDNPMSQDELAAHLGVTKASLCRWERGGMPFSHHFLAACAWLGIEPAVALFEKPVRGEDLTEYFQSRPSRAEEALAAIRDSLALIASADRTEAYYAGGNGSNEVQDAHVPTPRKQADQCLEMILDILGDRVSGQKAN